ncbi:cardiolipin synthase [Effusibacillus dendaii]|uniref:Cardiolipin synthase n=1 Tax=Effusibacillus dendaii TaxID=2743772 RepID=A0A7I8D9P0_9BACL|nr:cardiolipin synthase [Effusibacillus dendaii]BCJ86717.1 cardiolipin synthase 2 [Effusibacillus dendaii]
MKNIDWQFYLTLVYFLWFTMIAVLLVMEKRNPSKTLAWLMVLAAFPVVGFLFYLMFGQKYRKHRRLQSKTLPEEFSQALHMHAARHVKRTDELAAGTTNQKKWMRLLFANSHSPITENNRIELYADSKQAFASILSALRQAQSHIHLEYYILKNDQIGTEVQKILIEKARQGVHVRVIYDGIGSRKLKPSYIKNLQQAGVQITSFLPVYFPWLTSRINFRNHRKLIVIDGKIGFTGGLNIGDEYLGKGPLGHWQDTHIRLEGESVYYLQLIFLRDWYVAYNEYISEAEYFPQQDSFGKIPIQIAASGPDSDWEAIWQAHFSMFASARRKIYIVTPYLIPDESILMGLKTSALSGLDVRIILPAKPDYYIVHLATRSYFEELLRAGVRIYEYQNGFIHAKTIAVDGEAASVGTANLDVRSFQYNFEVNALIYEPAVVSQLEQIMQQHMADSREITLDDYLANRKIISKFLESSARLLSPLL